MTARCQIWARWTNDAVRLGVARRPSPEEYENLRARAARGASVWAPPVYEPEDAETDAALDARVREGLHVIFDADAIELEDPVPLLLEHGADPIVDDLIVTRTGPVFTATGWADAPAAAQLHGLHRVSPGFTILRAHLVDAGPGVRYVRATRARLHEVSATSSPVLDATILLVGRPGVSWLGLGGDEIVGDNGEEA